MLHTKTAETRWSSGYSELMFRHILCHHHYWHRPGVIRARMLVTQRQFCMTSSNDAKTDKSAQIRESKFSLMTQQEFCMISGNDTKTNEMLPIQTNASFARMSISSIQNFSLDWKIYVRESYFSSVSISASQCHVCKMYIFQESLSLILPKKRGFFCQLHLFLSDWRETYTRNVGW